MRSALSPYRIDITKISYKDLVADFVEQGYRERIGNSNEFGEVQKREEIVYLVVHPKHKLVHQVTNSAIEFRKKSGVALLGAGTPYYEGIRKVEETKKRSTYKTRPIIVTNVRSGMETEYSSVAQFEVYLKRFIRKGKDVNTNKIYQVIGKQNKGGGVRSIYGYHIRYKACEPIRICDTCSNYLFCTCQITVKKRRRKMKGKKPRTVRKNVFVPLFDVEKYTNQIESQ